MPVLPGATAGTAPTMLSGTYVINSVMVAAMTRASTAMTATMLPMTRVPMEPPPRANYYGLARYGRPAAFAVGCPYLGRSGTHSGGWIPPNRSDPPDVTNEPLDWGGGHHMNIRPASPNKLVKTVGQDPYPRCGQPVTRVDARIDRGKDDYCR